MEEETVENLSGAEVALHVAIFRLQYDLDSPCKGTIDTKYVNDLPVTRRKQIWDELPVDIKRIYWLDGKHTEEWQD